MLVKRSTEFDESSSNPLKQIPTKSDSPGPGECGAPMSFQPALFKMNVDGSYERWSAVCMGSFSEQIMHRLENVINDVNYVSPNFQEDAGSNKGEQQQQQQQQQSPPTAHAVWRDLDVDTAWELAKEKVLLRPVESVMHGGKSADWPNEWVVHIGRARKQRPVGTVGSSDLLPGLQWAAFRHQS
jgi:hypothetical protein